MKSKAFLVVVLGLLGLTLVLCSGSIQEAGHVLAQDADQEDEQQIEIAQVLGGKTGR